MARTRMKTLISMIRPNRKSIEEARMTRRMKNAKNRDHGFLLQQCKQAQSGRRSGTDSYDLRETLEVSPVSPAVSPVFPEVSRLRKRDQRVQRADIGLFESPELLARSVSFIPSPP